MESDRFALGEGPFVLSGESHVTQGFRRWICRLFTKTQLGWRQIGATQRFGNEYHARKWAESQLNSVLLANSSDAAGGSSLDLAVGVPGDGEPVR